MKKRMLTILAVILLLCLAAPACFADAAQTAQPKYTVTYAFELDEEEEEPEIPELEISETLPLIIELDEEYKAEEDVPFTVAIYLTSEWKAASETYTPKPLAELKLVLKTDGSLKLAENFVPSAKLTDLLSATETKPEHTWLGQSVMLSKSTCVKPGVMLTACSHKACTAWKVTCVYGAHTYGAAKTVRAATCDTTGLRQSVCSVCGYVLSETLATTAHTPATIAAVAPTCTKTGLTSGSFCSVCGTILTAQVTVPATGHTIVTDAGKAVTCTTTGLTAGSHCSVCGTVLVPQQTIPATGHSPVSDKAVAATCTATGKTAGSHCSVCGTVFVAQTEIPTLGHDWAATYTKGDTTHWYACSRCSEKKDETAHDLTYTYSEGGTHQGTCKTCGYTTEAADHDLTYIANEDGTHQIKCAICSYETSPCSTTLEYNSADGQHWQQCGDCGYKTASESCTYPEGDYIYDDSEGHYQTCIVCSGNSASVGCTYGNWETDPDHNGQHSRTCFYCKHEYVQDCTYGSYETDATNHTRYCTMCNYKEQAAHTFEWISDGSGKHYQKCSVCNYQTTPEACSLTYTHNENTQTHNVACTVCSYTQTNVGCTYGNWASDYNGQHSRTCNYCNYTYVQDCTYGSYVPDDAANHAHYCTMCNYKETAAHNVVTDTAVPATCTTSGLTEGSHCSVCNAVLTAQETISATGHSLSYPYIDSAIHREACSKCSYTADVPHTTVTDAAKDATCTETGLTEGSHCSLCGATIVAQEVIPRTYHDWKIVDTQQNEKGEIVITYQCTICYTVKTE